MKARLTKILKTNLVNVGYIIESSKNFKRPAWQNFETFVVYIFLQIFGHLKFLFFRNLENC